MHTFAKAKQTLSTKRHHSGSFGDDTSLESDGSQEEWQQIEENQRRLVPTRSQKYKTEMCKKWSMTGRCDYGPRCQFAHGRDELRAHPLSVLPAYKTKICLSFTRRMCCSYGSRCRFAHPGQKSLEDVNSESWYQMQLALVEGSFPRSDEKRRLNVFKKLGKDVAAVDGQHVLVPVKETLDKGEIMDSPRALSTGSSLFDDCETN